jgi:hypothetical protein
MSVSKNHLICLGILLQMLLVLSCQDVAKQRGQDAEKYNFGLQLQKGSKYYYTIINETKTQLEVNDKKAETGNKAEIGLLYEVVKDSSGFVSVKLTYDKLLIVLTPAEGGEQEYDASDSIYVNDPVIKMLRAIKGSALVINLNSKGDVLNVEGSNEIYQKVMAGLNVPDDASKKQLQGQLSKLVGVNFVKGNLEQGFQLFPDTALQEGDKWNNKLIQEADIKFEGLAEYELTSVKNNTATVEEKSAIANDKKTSIDIMGYKVSTAMKGKQDGLYKIDTKTGMIINGESSAFMEGTMQIMGQEIPVTVKVNKKISVKKL